MFTLVRLTSAEWLRALRPEGARLHLQVPAAPRLRQRMAVRIQLVDVPVEATLVGLAVSVHQEDGRQHRVELAVDADSQQAVRMLAAAARSGHAGFVPRSTRYLVDLPVLVSWAGGDVYASTVSISRGGCALRWAGPPPPRGALLRLRIGGGPQAALLEGEVIWRLPGGPASTAGVRFLARAAGVSFLMADAERRGAPQA